MVRINYDEATEKISRASEIETVDLGVVSLHLITIDGRRSVVLENAGSYDDSVFISVSA